MVKVHPGPSVHASVFLLSSQAEVAAMAQDLAASRKRVLRPASGAGTLQPSTYFSTIAPPGMVQCKAEYERAFISESAPQPWLADLAHHPGMGPRHGSLMPSLDTHPHIFTWDAPPPVQGERFITPRELLASLGVDTFPTLSGGRPLSGLLAAMVDQPRWIPRKRTIDVVFLI